MLQRRPDIFLGTNFHQQGGRASAGLLTRRDSRLHQKIYIRLAAERARVQPARSPFASSRLARAIVAENLECKRSRACFNESGVGCSSSCAPIDCAAVNPAFGFPADWRISASNLAMSSLHGPAWAIGTFMQSRAQPSNPAFTRSFLIEPRSP